MSPLSKNCDPNLVKSCMSPCSTSTLTSRKGYNMIGSLAVRTQNSLNVRVVVPLISKGLSTDYDQTPVKVERFNKNPV